ncbi:MAG: cold shock domain-containing protein CspD [Pseudomonadota bacterium]
MATGTVKWFNNAKGYGFVLPEGGGDDLFVHYSSIQMDGYKSLKAGQLVDYDVQEGPKGLHAVNIRAASKADAALTQEESSEETAETSEDVRSAQSTPTPARDARPEPATAVADRELELET